MQTKSPELDRQGMSMSFGDSARVSSSADGPRTVAVRGVRRCLRPRGVVRRSRNADDDDHLRQSFPLAVRNMSRTDRIHSDIASSDAIRPDG